MKKTKHRLSLKEKWFVVALAVLVVLAFLVLGEMVVRTFRPQLTYTQLRMLAGSYYAPGRFIPHTLQSNYKGLFNKHQDHPGEQATVSTNCLALRGHEISLTKLEGRKRVLILGDSYTFGVYVNDNETYSVLLENLFREDENDVEVINAGYAGGFGPDTQYAWLVNRGLTFQPDLVIYAFFVGNDILDIHPTSNWHECDERGLPTDIVDKDIYVDKSGNLRRKTVDYTTVARPLIYKIPLFRESHLAVLINKVIERVYGKIVTSGNDDRLRWGENPFCFITKAESNEMMLEKESLFFRLVEGMCAVSNKQGAKFMLLMVPVNFQVEPEFLPKVLGPAYDGGKWSIERNYFEELKPWLEERGIAYLDLLKKMKTANGYYFPRDGEVHFNCNGHFFVAKELYKFLNNQDYL